MHSSFVPIADGIVVMCNAIDASERCDDAQTNNSMHSSFFSIASAVSNIKVCLVQAVHMSFSSTCNIIGACEHNVSQPNNVLFGCSHTTEILTYLDEKSILILTSVTTLADLRAARHKVIEHLKRRFEEHLDYLLSELMVDDGIRRW